MELHHLSSLPYPMTEFILLRSLNWQNTLDITFSEDHDAVALLIQSAKSVGVSSQETKLKVISNSTNLDTSKWEKIIVEGSKNSQLRSWKKNILDTSSVVISLIVAIFAGVKQLEEEKKRKRADEIKQAIDTFDTIIINDFPQALADYLELIWDWDAWEKPMQKQFREKFSSFVDTDEFWNRLSNRSVSEIEKDVDRSLQLCVAVSINKEQLVLLKDAIQQDTHFLLTLVRKHSQSIAVAKRVAKALSDERKRKIREEFGNEFQSEIIALKDELGFLEKNFPLQEQFHHFAIIPHIEDKIAKWLEMRQMQYSPFLDANSPYTLLIGEKKPFIDHVSTSFAFTTSNHPISTFGFANPWDVGAALFEYCKTLQIQPNIIDETFVVILTPTIGADYGACKTRKLVLHALAEQWLWSLSEKPTMLYDLHQTPRALLGRLLRWHSGSPFAAINRIEQLIEKRTDSENTINIPRKIIEWLNNIDTTDLRTEEINSLIELRPPLKRRTMLLVSSVDINPWISTQITVKQHEMLDGEADWLDIHGWALMHFLLDGTNPQTITMQVLSNQCNLRTRKCSNEKIEAFNALFAPHDKEPADIILASKAKGSPGKMVRLGQNLLLQHVEKYPPEDDLQIDDLLAIE
jgi:hypothetical protein